MKVLNRDLEVVELTELEAVLMQAVVDWVKSKDANNLVIYYNNETGECNPDWDKNNYRDKQGMYLIWWCDEACEKLGWTRRKITGVVGSLEKKKIYYSQAGYNYSKWMGGFNDIGRIRNACMAVWYWQECKIEHPQKSECKFWEVM